MPQLIYDVQFKIDQSSLSGLKNIVDSSTTGEVTKLTEKIEKLESQLNKLKGTNQKVSKSTKQLVDQSKRKTDAVKRDEAILKRALQTNNLNNKSVQEAAVRLQQGTAALEGHTNEMSKASVSTKRSATSQQALAKQVTTTTGTITRATNTLQQFNQQVNRSQKGFKGSNKEFAIANQTLFGFGDLAQDATQFSQGFAQGMRAIGNNIAFNAEMFGTLKTRTGSYTAAFRALGASFTGVGGAILAVNVAVMVATSLLTKFGNKAKDTTNDLKDFAKATDEIAKVSDAEFLDINSLESQRRGLLELKQVVEDLEREEKELLSASKKYSSYIMDESKVALKEFRDENKSLLDVELKALKKELKTVNERLALQNALLKLSPLSAFRFGMEQATDVLINNFEAGLITSSSALEHQRDLLQDYIDKLRQGDINTLEVLGLDKDTPLAPTILNLMELIDKLTDAMPELKPILTLEDLGSDIEVSDFLPDKSIVGDEFLQNLFGFDIPKLDILEEDNVLRQQAKDQQDAISQVMELGAEARAAEANAAMESAMEGSIFMAQKKLKELKESLLKENDISRREELQAAVNQQQKVVNALTAGLGPVRTVLDDIIDAFDPSRVMIDPNQFFSDGVSDQFTQDLFGTIDVPTLDIIGEDDVLKQQATDREQAMTQIMKDGVDARLNEVNREIEANKKAQIETEIAEKGKQAARQLGVQGAQAVSQAIQGLFGESKEIAIAETIISTYFAAQKAFESQMLIPSPDAPVRANIAAGVAIAQGLARVAAIRNTDKSGGGGGGGGRSGGGGGGIGSRPRASGLFGTTDTASGSALNNQPLFTPNASEKNRGITVMVNNTFDDRTVASVASNGNDQRREGAVSGLG
jgi:hypothetical protein